MPALPTPLRYLGAPGSPYTRKMRALLCYRIPEACSVLDADARACVDEVLSGSGCEALFALASGA